MEKLKLADVPKPAVETSIPAGSPAGSVGPFDWGEETTQARTGHRGWPSKGKASSLFQKTGSSTANPMDFGGPQIMAAAADKGWPSGAEGRGQRREPDPKWLEDNENAILPPDALPSEDFWTLPLSLRRYYKSQIEILLGFIPSPYLRPRVKDVQRMEVAKVNRARGYQTDLPQCVFPARASGEEYRSNREAVRKGIKFGRLD